MAFMVSTDLVLGPLRIQRDGHSCGHVGKAERYSTGTLEFLVTHQ